MTNSEDNEKGGCEQRLATVYAVRLIGQILNEAYVIANAASESGQPWRHLAMLKNIRSIHNNMKDAEDKYVTYCASNADNDDAIVDKMDDAAKFIVTSTPQKGPIGENVSVMHENSLIGQGDHDTEMRKCELKKSTSMFINHLFDMSEVERVITCDNSEAMRTDSNDLLTEAMTNIMESYVNSALGIAFGQEVPNKLYTEGEISPSTDNSGYSLLADAYTTQNGNDMTFCVDHGETYENIEYGGTSAEQEGDKNKANDRNRKDVDFYENTFLTLNRDYDQCSDEDGEPVLHDTKGMSLQEVELMAMNTPVEETLQEITTPTANNKDFAAISDVSASASGSRKSKLVQQCRSQGARLLACLRGWWRRKTPGKRKEARIPGSVRSMCPLSPDARRRAASLLGQRRLFTSSPPSKHVVWKFNTVSEALVNSSRWKNYTFDVNPDKCG